MDKGYAEISCFGYKKVVFDGTPPGAGRLDGGSWFPLGSQENALEGRGHLFEPQASCASCPPPLAFFCKLRGTLPEFLKARDRRGTGAPPATMTHRTCPHIFFHIHSYKKACPTSILFASAAGPLKYVLNYILSQHLS